ncbi:hypothetical protein INT45_011477 [Circinella minor]|uniref:Uncharacterized protein n=1 Tax=Circinella minor TaxID=1195481 RepID=A0A8H7S1J9_9FUNG|nr:hypothetical protein INT45_011477 [Circinella minor]
MQPPPISHEMKPTPAIIDTTTNVAATPLARSKKVYPAASQQKEEAHNKSACIQHSCVTKITEASKFFHNQAKFEYIHIPCLQHRTRQEIRQLFRSLKINTSRVLNISYPGRNIISILVHQHYLLPQINAMLQEANIPTLTNFDPIHPENLKNFKYEKCSLPERSTISKQCHRQRSRFFNSKGWIDQSDFDHIMSSPRQL